MIAANASFHITISLKRILVTHDLPWDRRFPCFCTFMRKHRNPMFGGIELESKLGHAQSVCLSRHPSHSLNQSTGILLRSTRGLAALFFGLLNLSQDVFQFSVICSLYR